MKKISVEVSYCLPQRQHCIELELEAGASVAEAIACSGLDTRYGFDFSGNPAPNRVGIYGKKCTLDTHLTNGDRIEIYRPLLLSPTEARRLRARTDPLQKPSAK